MVQLLTLLVLLLLLLLLLLLSCSGICDDAFLAWGVPSNSRGPVSPLPSPLLDAYSALITSQYKYVRSNRELYRSTLDLPLLTISGNVVRDVDGCEYVM